MSISFHHLYKEPDIPANIFIHLSIQDLLQAELVCKRWRNLIIEQRIWKKKLEKNFKTLDVWKIQLTHHEWHPRLFLSHEENKKIVMKISSILGPTKITYDILDCISMDTSLDWKKAVSCAEWDEENFMAQRLYDYQTLTIKLQNKSRSIFRGSLRFRGLALAS